jgi:putative DNA primase/helicase
MVRAPLMWLDKADPVASMEAARDEDSDLTDISELLGFWRNYLGSGGAFTALEIRQNAYQHPEFHDLLLRVAGDKSGISTKRLGAWLRRIQGRIVGGFRLVSRPGRAGGHAPSFFMQSGRQTEE